jgi:hypothetical protein
MKRLLTICVLFIASFSSANEKERFGLGIGGGVYDGDYGIQARKDFVFGEEKRSEIVLQGSFYNHNRFTFRFDADYHLVFLPEGPFRLYPLAGLDFAINSNDNKFGLNLGGGMTFPLIDQYAAFIEAKYTAGTWDGFALTAGVYF